MTDRQPIPAARGRLGILLPGLGAVATTFVAGVEGVRRGLAKPIGSLTQMNTIRLGKRTDARTPLIREFLPLATLDDLVFGAWDPIPDDAYRSAVNAGVLEARHVEPIRDFLESVVPMPAVFSSEYVRRLEGSNVKKGSDKYDRRSGGDLPWDERGSVVGCGAATNEGRAGSGRRYVQARH